MHVTKTKEPLAIKSYIRHEILTVLSKSLEIVTAMEGYEGD